MTPKSLISKAPKPTGDFFAESERKAIRLVSERQRAYSKFFRTPDGKAFAKKFGRSYHNSSFYFSGNGECDISFHDPADLPKASINDHPIERIEPEQDNGFSEGGLNVQQLITLRDTFRSVFRWALDGEGLVVKGLRCNVCVMKMKPTLGIGLFTAKEMLREFDYLFEPEAVLFTGFHFGRVIEWLSRGNPVSARGERVDLLAYTLWPSLIDAGTLATLGQMNGKTRQAKDKLANCLRDTFAGIKALAMRNDVTRERCKVTERALPICWYERVL